MDKLMELAERCEKATEGQQSGLIWEIGAAIFGEDEPEDSHSPHAWFTAFAHAEAWLSAAMTLVPEGAEWWMPFPNEARISFDNTVFPPLPQRCATPALALCAAALRARATQGRVTSATE